MNCSVTHFNNNNDSNIDPGEVCLQLLKYSRSIATGDKVKDRINEGEPIIKQYIEDKPFRDKSKSVESEMRFIYTKISELEYLYDATTLTYDLKKFLDDYKPKLDRIKDILGPDDELVKNLGDAVVSVAMEKCADFIKSQNQIGAMSLQTSHFSHKLHPYF